MTSSYANSLPYDPFWTSTPFNLGDHFLSFEAIEPSLLENSTPWNPNNLALHPVGNTISSYPLDFSTHQTTEKEWMQSNPTPPPEKPCLDWTEKSQPREQKLRFPGDAYTPRWVRFRGQAKEGLCELCPTPKWLQLKNSAFWYHKQFVHGISSVSGLPFWQPTEKRWIDQVGKRVLEGLCPQCQKWIPLISPQKRHPNRMVAWYRHAYKCHDYLKMS